MPSGPPPSSASSPQQPVEGQKRLFAGALPRIVVSLLIAGGFAWLLARGGLPLVPSEEALRRIPFWAVAAYALIQVPIIVLRTYRWVYLLRPLAPRVPVARVLGIGFVGFSAIFFAPLRMGEIVRPYLIAKDGEVTFMQAAGTIFAERVIDGLVLTLFTVISMTLATTVSPLPRYLGDLPLPLATVPAAVYTATAAFVGLFVVMTAFYAAREQARRATRFVVGLVSLRAADWAATTLERVADGLGFLPSRKHSSSFMGITLVYWALTISGQWLLMRGVGLPATFTQAATMVGIIGLGSVVPAGPGLFGAFQIASFSALALFFPLSEVRSGGAALVFVAYVAQLAMTCVQLLAGFAFMARSRPAAVQ
jgi:glycosyltransferase 2 family protein